MNDRRYDQIYQAVRRIPAGRVASYGAVARAAGLPGRARLVGTALREAPDGLELPWYRVVRADGRIAFPPGSASYERQRERLGAEGVPVTCGRIDRAFHWREDLDRLLWGPE